MQVLRSGVGWLGLIMLGFAFAISCIQALVLVGLQIWGDRLEFWTDPCADAFPVLTFCLVGPIALLGLVLAMLGTPLAKKRRLKFIFGGSAGFVGCTLVGIAVVVAPRQGEGWRPYVALDLGDGKTMQLDPRTMICTYSD